MRSSPLEAMGYRVTSITHPEINKPLPRRSRSSSEVEPARGLEPLTARLQGGCSAPHPAPTSNYSHVADPTGSPIPHQVISFRTTTRTTELGQRGSRGHLAVLDGRHCNFDVQLTRSDATSWSPRICRTRARWSGTLVPESACPGASLFRRERVQSQGLKTRMPVSAESLVLRVPSPRSYWRQMAAVRASAMLIGLPDRSREATISACGALNHH